MFACRQKIPAARTASVLSWLDSDLILIPDVQWVCVAVDAREYPFVPLLYMVAALSIRFVLLLYKTQTCWPGLVIVLFGVPVYFLWSRTPPWPRVELRFGHMGAGNAPLRGVTHDSESNKALPMRFPF